MLYVGLSRARTQLVVYGDLELIARIGGEGVRKRCNGLNEASPALS
jgi:ATP-dependent exoDNAse (exonuclease V) alpha subunit